MRAEVKAAAALGQSLKGHDLVIVARPATATAPFALMREELARGLRQLGLLQP